MHLRLVKAIGGDFIMEKVKVIRDGDEQMIVLPKGFKLPNEEIFIGHDGNIITLMTKEEAIKIFREAINSFTEDIFPNGREPQEFTGGGISNEVHD